MTETAERAEKELGCATFATCVVDPDRQWIRFNPCGVVSRNKNDIENKYCAKCHRFIGDLAVILGLR